MNTLTSPSPPGSVSNAPRSSLAERWFNFRNRFLASPRFQRWAAAFPLTRAATRRRAAALFDVCAGFVYSQVLFSAVKLGLFEALAAGPKSLATLAEEFHLPLENARKLLEAAASLRLVERRGPDLFGLGTDGAVLLGNPGIAAMVEHHALLYRDLTDPVALLRGERTAEMTRFWNYRDFGGSGAPTQQQVAEYSALMASSQLLISEDILEAYPLARHRRLLDVGGGEGVFASAALRSAPGLSVMLFDLPLVAERARARLGRDGLADRSQVFGGDAFREPLPTGADVASLVRVVHDHDDADALTILRAVHAALPPGGTLLLAEPMSGAQQADPLADAYLGFYLLAMGRGRPRSPETLFTLLESAGFHRARLMKTRRPLFVQLIRATRVGP